MSFKIKDWLRRLGIETTHEERQDIDREVEQKTGKPCDEGIDSLSETEFLIIVNKIKKKTKILAEVLA